VAVPGHPAVPTASSPPSPPLANGRGVESRLELPESLASHAYTVEEKPHPRDRCLSAMIGQQQDEDGGRRWPETSVHRYALAASPEGGKSHWDLA